MLIKSWKSVEKRENNKFLNLQVNKQILTFRVLCPPDAINHVPVSFLLLGAGSSAGRKGQQPQSQSQAELERQQILNKMKKKASLQRDGSWIRQSSTTTPTNKGESDPPFMRR